MSGILSLLCFSKGKRLELGFKMRVVWSERGLGPGLGVGVTMASHVGYCLEGRERSNSGDGRSAPPSPKPRMFTGGPAGLHWARENSVVKPL